MRGKLILLPILLIGGVLQSQAIKNSDFDDECKGEFGLDCDWKKSWGKENCCSIKDIDGESVLVLTGAQQGAVSFVEQEVIIEQSENAILRLQVSVKTLDVVGKGAGLNITTYNVAGDLLMTQDVGGAHSPAWGRGTQDWKKQEIRVIVSAETHRIKVGGILYGKGEAYFDNFSLKLEPIAKREPSAVAKAYVAEAIEVIRLHSLYRDSVDLISLEKVAGKIAGDAKQPKDCYLAVEFMLSSLRKHGDNHSFFMPAAEAERWANDTSETVDITLPTVEVKDQVAHVVVPPFNSGNEKVIKRYAEHLQQEIKAAADTDLKGWVVDLRQNTGGNMEPMIIGLGPILDEGKLGSLVDVNGKHETWYNRDGSCYWDDTPGVVLENPFEVEQKLPIAALFSPRTGSSGEAVAISFIGNSRTITMGQPTWGLTTGNGNFKLSDGSDMFLASTKMVDRNGEVYNDKVEPDVSFDASKLGEDLLLDFARFWVRKSYDENTPD